MIQLPQLSIKHKLNGIIMLTCSIALVISTVVFLFVEVVSYRRIMTDDMMTLADVIGKNSSAALVFGDIRSAEETLSALDSEPSVLLGAILKPSGDIFATYTQGSDFSDDFIKGLIPQAFLDQGQTDLRMSWFAENRLNLCLPIILDRENIGTVLLQASMAGLHVRLKKHGIISALLLLPILTVAFLLSVSLQRIISGPILHLSQTMQSISNEKKYSIRAIQHSTDELGVLIAGFNDMLSNIEMRDAKLEEHKAQLENQVHLRTMELESSNAELKRAVTSLARARDLAEGANRAKSEFLANMSHELRTPLNHIIGFTEIVVDKKLGQLSQRQEEYLKNVLQTSRHLLSLINDILDISKVESGKMELHASVFDITLAIENSCMMIKEKALKHRLQVSVDISPKLPKTINADERKFKQILYNLLSNAVKFTPEGGEIGISARLNGDSTNGRQALISVSDTGTGIGQQNLERIFDPFEQVDGSASRKYEGTGLGLSLTKQMVELHCGEIWAASDGIDKGSTFHFTIPI